MRISSRAIFWGLPLALCLQASDSTARTYTIQTVAGSDFVGDNGLAIAAVFSQTEGIAADRAGNIYVADADDNRVRKITPDGIIHTVAGSGMAGFSGDGGPGTAALLDHPYGLAVDASGNLYIADLGNARVRRIGSDGIISTVAGGGITVPDTSGTAVAAANAKLIQPRNLAVDNDGTLYISDFGAHRVFRLSPGGTLTAIAGTGKAGFAGDGAPALLAQLNSPAGLASDSNGTLYIADSGNNRIRKINHGLISTAYSVSAPTGVALTPGAVLYIAGASYFGTMTQPMKGFAAARDVATDAAGNVYATAGQVVGKVAANGNVSTLAGSGAAPYFAGENAPATSARFHTPTGIAVDGSGNWYVADTANHRVRRITPGGIVTTIAGNGVAGSAGDGALATAAQLNSPRSVAIDAQGNVYIADTGNNRIRKISPGGIISTFTNAVSNPEYVAVGPDSALYVADAGNNRVLRLTAAGSFNSVATVLKPAAVTVDRSGNVYVSESARVSKISPQGVLSTVLDGLNSPRGLAMTADGSLLIVQPGVDIVLSLSAAGNLATIAGTGTPGFSGDGGAAQTAQLNQPTDIAVDATGTAWVADSGNNRIRSLTPVAAAAITQNVALVHAASLAAGPIAPGEIVTFFGSQFQPGQTDLQFDGKSAMIFYISATQINALTPPDLVPGASTEITIRAGGQTVADFPSAVVSATPGIFTSGSGTGQAAADNQDGSMNSLANPADRGSIVVLFGTGDGRDTSAVSVSIGGFAAEVLYAGSAPGFPGLLQVNARVPGGTAPTGVVPVVVTVGTASSQDGVTLVVR